MYQRESDKGRNSWKMQFNYLVVIVYIVRPQD